MKDKRDIELNVFNKNETANYVDLKGFDDEIEFINFDKAPVSFTDRIKNITKISNRELLLVTTVFFALFVICEVIGGLASNSLSLLGDAGAMTIDVCSYGFNFFAEYIKAKETPGVKSSMFNDCIIEVLIPGVSVMSLLVVTGWVCSDAVLRLLGHKEEDVDVTYLYSFAVANLVVDVICTWLFYVRRQDVFLQPSKVEPGKEGEHGDDTSMGMYDLEDVEIVLCADYNDDSEQKDFSFDGKGNSAHLLKTKNLNMISAFTHVGGDTLRSFTVLLAAMVSSTFDIDATLTDAVAAIVVSVTIVVAVMPLMYSLGVTILDYKVRFKAAKENNKNYRGLKTESEDESSTHALNDQSNSNSSSSLSSGDKVYTTTGKISPKKSSAHKLRPGEIDKDEDEITL